MKRGQFKILFAAIVSIFLLITIPAHANTSIGAYPKYAKGLNANCGVLSIAWLLEKVGKYSAAESVRQIIPSSVKGHNIKELELIASGCGYKMKGMKLSLQELNYLPLPAIIHFKGHKSNATGHYSILQKIEKNRFSIYDPQINLGYKIFAEELNRKWSRYIIAGSERKKLPAATLSEKEARMIYGAGHSSTSCPRGLSNLGGDPFCKNQVAPYGAPAWGINRVNFNLVITDIPLWYASPIGPSVRIQLTYNAQAQFTGIEPFGKKWRLNYSSYLEENGTTGDVVLIMPDGRVDEFVSDGSGDYTKPYQVFNNLTKVAADHFELRTVEDMVYIYRIPAGSGLTIPHLVEMRNPRGQSLIFAYNANGELTTITDALGRSTTLTYTGGNVTRATDPFGRHADFEYQDGNLTRITDMGGIWAALSYDDESYVTSLANDRGITYFKIEPAFGISSVAPIPPPDAMMGRNYRITVTDPLGNKSEYYYNGHVGYGWYVSPENYMEYVDENNNHLASNVPKTLIYYADTVKGIREEIKTIVYPEGRTVNYTHDYDTGQVLSVSGSYGDTTSYTYNEKGFVSSITPEIGAATNLIYDPNNDVDLTQIERVGLGSVTLTYNPYHEVTSIMDMVGKQINPINYNSNGQVVNFTSIHDDHSILTEYTYFSSGHGSQHQLQTVIKGGETIVQLTYDDKGRVSTFTDASGRALTYGYNNLNHITNVTYPDSKFVQFSYSGCCPRLMDSYTDRAGRTTSFNYDALQRITERISPDGSRMSFEYDVNGNMVRFTDPSQNATLFEYDLENRVVKKTYADGKSISLNYDANGMITKRIDSRGVITDYIYDGNYNLLNILYLDNTHWVSFEYDDYNRLVNMQDASGTHDYTYYADSAPHTASGPWDNDTITYTYDKLGRMSGAVPQSGQALVYTYDDLNRLTNIQSGTDNFAYGYTGADPLVQTLTRPGGAQTIYKYNDPLKRLTALINNDASSQLVNRFDYAYTDTAHPDQRSSETVTNGPSFSFTQDELTHYDHNSLNQLIRTTAPEKMFTYDDAGNMTKGYTPDGYEFTATYDGENRLSSIEYTDSGSTVHKAEYIYSGYGFLAQIKKYENSTPVGDIRIVRSGYLAIQERDASNQVVRKYTWGKNMGGGIGGLLSMNQSGSLYAYLYDGRGNVNALLNTSQQVAASYRYDSFGNLMAKTGTLDQPFGFSTKRYDAGTGLSYYGYRFYNPSIGKWLTRDPIGEAGGINLYGFVLNDPVNAVDPLGLFSPFGGPGFTNVMPSKPPSWSEQANNYPSPVPGLGEGVNMHNAIPGQFAALGPAAIIKTAPIINSGVISPLTNLLKHGTPIFIIPDPEMFENIFSPGSAEASEPAKASACP